MSACWQALQARGVDLAILAVEPGGDNNAPFSTSTFSGLPIDVVLHETALSEAYVLRYVERANPDLLIVSGWWNRAYRRVATIAGIPYVVTVDTPYGPTWQPLALRLRYGRFLSDAAQVVVPGERAWQLLTRAGIPPRKVSQRLYGVASVSDTCRNPKDRAFLFLGQYTKRKGFDVLLEAYGNYRTQSSNPFKLWLAGDGPLRTTVTNGHGVTNHGFVQPSHADSLRASASILVLPSRHDAWPLALVEGAEAELGLICTPACGNAAELLRDGWNGRLVPPGDLEELTAALHWAQAAVDTSIPLGRRSASLAAPYVASEWALHWETLLRRAR
jgi:glycosyltransferase involved in cell wall biosynthesis